MKDIKNAYRVETYGVYGGYPMKIFSLAGAESEISVATSAKEISSALCLSQINVDWYMKRVNITDLSAAWEERSPALGLPMPEGLAVKEFITLRRSEFV